MTPRTALCRLACLVATGVLLTLPAAAQDDGAPDTEIPATENPGAEIPAAQSVATSPARVRGVATWRRYIWTLERPLLAAVMTDLEASRRENPATDPTRDFLLAYAQLTGGRREEGVESTGRLREFAPSFVGLKLLDGIIAIHEDQDDAARTRFDEYLDGLRETGSDPNFATDLEMLGLVHRGALAASTGQNEQALRDYNAAVAMARRSGRRPATQLVQRLARVHQNENQMHLAEELMLELMKEDPGNANHYFNIGVLRAAQNDFDGARVWFARALRRQPGFADAHAKLAAVAAKQIRLVDMRRHLDAFAALIHADDADRQAESDAGYADYYHRMSRQFDAEGRTADRDEALRRLRIVGERALEKRPTCLRALQLMLRAGSALGLSAEVLQTYRERLRAIRSTDKAAEGAFRRTLC